MKATLGRVPWLVATTGLSALWLTYGPRRKRYSLQGKRVLITGGSRGLGLVLARQFAAAGARLALCARDEAELERARYDLLRQGCRAQTFVCDIADPAQVEQLVVALRERFGSIDVLVNNAGVIQVGPFEDMTQADFEEAMGVYFWGPFHLCRALVPQMQQRRSGRVVNISSIGGIVSVPHLLPYCSGKFALTGFSEGLRASVLKDNVYVTTVCPGLMRTGSPANAFFKGRHRREYAWFSISDSLPILSMSAEKAAARIVESCVRGDASLVLTLPAKVAVWMHALFPGLTANVLTLVDQLLPSPGGIGKERVKGAQSTSLASPSWLTSLGDRAAVANNELTPAAAAAMGVTP